MASTSACRPTSGGVAGRLPVQRSYGATPRGISVGLLANRRAAPTSSCWRRPRSASGEWRVPGGGQHGAGLRLARRHGRARCTTPAVATTGEQNRRLHRQRRLRVPRAVQQLRHRAAAEQLLHGQRRGVHLRLVSRRHAQRVVDLGKRRHRHLDQQHAGGRQLHGLCGLQPHRPRQQRADGRQRGPIHAHLSRLSRRLQQRSARPGQGR